jgi:HSP20 family molecular chaperone IbpA
MSDTVVKNEERKMPVYRPATDILEREDGFYIFMDLPGVSKENLCIDLEEDELSVSGHKAVMGEGERYAEMQFGGGEFRQTVSLSDIVDREGIEANLNNGVLEIHLPRAESFKPRRIEITEG